MVKELVVTIRFPLPDVPKVMEKIAHATVITGVKQMFPKGKLPKCATVDFKIREKRGS